MRRRTKALRTNLSWKLKHLHNPVSGTFLSSRDYKVSETRKQSGKRARVAMSQFLLSDDVHPTGYEGESEGPNEIDEDGNKRRKKGVSCCNRRRDFSKRGCRRYADLAHSRLSHNQRRHRALVAKTPERRNTGTFFFIERKRAKGGGVETHPFVAILLPQLMQSFSSNMLGLPRYWKSVFEDVGFVGNGGGSQVRSDRLKGK